VDGNLQSGREPIRPGQHHPGQSSESKVEAEVLSDVASYGKQLGRVSDALIVLLRHFHPRTPLSADEQAAIDALKEMLNHIAHVKDKHKRPALRYVSV
jgi:hypothetical protein